ncbi:MAG: TonB-dependent receptor [Pseudohongiellaceae bacterium]
MCIHQTIRANKQPNPLLLAAVLLILPATHVAGQAEEQEQSHATILHEVVITAPFQQSEAETALPVTILSGEELREKVSNSLGDTLRNEAGIANASFGVGVGHPVIRGQTGNRVSILQNGVGVSDASNVSADHANGVEASLANRLEVIRGPATLLYGSGAVGGVVNVIDNRIPERLLERTDFLLEQQHNTASNEDKTVLRLNGSAGTVGFHLDAFQRNNGNVKVPGYAIDEVALETLEELGESAHEEDGHEEEEHEEVENSYGHIGNSNGKGNGGTLGLSWVGPRGFIGFSANEINFEYGLPAGAHSHEHEEHDEDMEDPDASGDPHEEEELEFVRVNMEQRRYDIKGMLNFDNSWVESLTAAVGFTDYQHDEVETFHSGESEIGTTYRNEGLESRITLNRATTSAWEGVWGMQFSDTEFSASGEEAFIPRSNITSVGLFGVERFVGSGWTGELGVRLERNEVDPDGRCGSSETVSSVSGSVILDLSDTSSLVAGVARSQRAPTVEELYSNVDATSCAPTADHEALVLHAATGLLEVGNPELGAETSNNIEFGWRTQSRLLASEVNAYYNTIDDFIWLNLNSDLYGADEASAVYQARNAVFTGIEAELLIPIADWNNSGLELLLVGDYVRARFDASGTESRNVPRIPPVKMGMELRWFGNNWSTHFHIARTGKQDDTAELELETDGYTLISLYADYHLPVSSDYRMKLFIRGDNLLDEEVRTHTSFLKNYAPELGRGVILGLRLEY